MDSDNDSYHSESEFYYPDEENIRKKSTQIYLPQKKITRLPALVGPYLFFFQAGTVTNPAI